MAADGWAIKCDIGVVLPTKRPMWKGTGRQQKSHKLPVKRSQENRNRQDNAFMQDEGIKDETLGLVTFCDS